MKRTLAAMLAVSTLAAALPAAAHTRAGGEDRYLARHQAERLEQRIDHLRRSGDLNWRQARDLHRQVDALQRLEWRYRHDGLSRWERRDLERGYAEVEDRLHRRASGGWDRSDWGDRDRRR